jgi:hypothetical protein
MTVDPKITTYIGLVTCIAMVLATASLWTGWIPDNVAIVIVGVTNVVAKIGVAVMTYLSSVSSSARGPVAMKMGWH